MASPCEGSEAAVIVPTRAGLLDGPRRHKNIAPIPRLNGGLSCRHGLPRTIQRDSVPMGNYTTCNGKPRHVCVQRWASSRAHLLKD
jgi:hypothetical protein